MKVCHLFYQKKKYGGSESYVELLEKYSKHIHKREYVNKKYPYLPSILDTLLGFRDLARRVVSSGKYDIIHSHFFIPAYYVQKFGGKSVITSHCLLSEEYKSAIHDAPDLISKIDMFLSWKICVLLEKYMYPKLKNLLVLSKFHAEELKKLKTFPKILYPPIDIKQFRTNKNKKMLRKKLGIPNKFTLLFLARPTYLKGLHVLIKCINLIKDLNFQLIIVGESYQIQKNTLCYLPCVRSSKIFKKGNFFFRMKVDPSRIIIIKEKKHEEIQEYFKASDVLICPSLYEAFGFVNMEAMASKIPVIASKVGGIPEIVRDRYNGLLFNPGDAKDLAKKISIFLKSLKMRKRLSQNAYDFIKRYNFPKHINYLDKFYLKIYEKN